MHIIMMRKVTIIRSSAISSVAIMKWMNPLAEPVPTKVMTASL
jgi:hypothetical protein